MNTKTLFFRLGAFILLGLAALIALLAAVGTGALFQKSIMMETYFNESVRGLEVGSKVLFRGVPVGDVTELTFTYVDYELDRPPEQRRPYVLVRFRVNPKLIGAISDREELARIVAEQVVKGLRVREAPLGLTGVDYLEMDYVDPKTHPSLAVDWMPRDLYVPSAPSGVGELFRNAEELVRHLAGVDIQGLATNINTLVVTLTRKADELEPARASKEAIALLVEARETVQRVRKIVSDPAWDAMPRDIGAASRDAAAVAARIRRVAESGELESILAHLQHTVSRIDRLVAGHEGDVAATLKNLRQITENLRELSESARRYPPGVIFGDPPRRELPGR